MYSVCPRRRVIVRADLRPPTGRSGRARRRAGKGPARRHRGRAAIRARRQPPRGGPYAVTTVQPSGTPTCSPPELEQSSTRATTRSRAEDEAAILQVGRFGAHHPAVAVEHVAVGGDVVGVGGEAGWARAARLSGAPPPAARASRFTSGVTGSSGASRAQAGRRARASRPRLRCGDPPIRACAYWTCTGSPGCARGQSTSRSIGVSCERSTIRPAASTPMSRSAQQRHDSPRRWTSSPLLPAPTCGTSCMISSSRAWARVSASKGGASGPVPCGPRPDVEHPVGPRLSC